MDGDPQASQEHPGLAYLFCFSFFFFQLDHVICSVLYQDNKNRLKEANKGRMKIFFFFIHLLYMSGVWSEHRTDVRFFTLITATENTRFVFPCCFFRCHHTVLGDNPGQRSSENNSFGLLICQLANCKAAKNTAWGLSRHCLLYYCVSCK